MHLNEDFVERTLKSAGTFLARWQDVNARLIDLTVSHRSVTLLLESPGRTGNLYIACLDPLWMTGPFQWKGAQIGLGTFTDDANGDGFVLTDPAAKFELRFGMVEVKENVKLKGTVVGRLAASD